MKLGINYPYSCADHRLDDSLPDFGMSGDPISYWKRERTEGSRRATALVHDLERMSDLGVNALRWFLFNLSAPVFGRPTFVEDEHTWEGLISSNDAIRSDMRRNHSSNYAAFGWRFNMPSVADCEPFRRDFVLMLEQVAEFNRGRAESRKVRIVPTWTDYRMFLGCASQYIDSTGLRNPYELLRQVSERMGVPYVSPRSMTSMVDLEREFARLMANPAFSRLGRGSGGGGKIDLLINLTTRQDFYRRLVIPLLDTVYARNDLVDQVLFWDIGNELDALALKTISSDPSPAAVDSLTLSMYRFVCEMIQLHTGRDMLVDVGPGQQAIYTARTGGRAKTTVGWLWCGDDGERGLYSSIQDRRLLRENRAFNVPQAVVEDVLQYHAYMSSHQDRTVQNIPSRPGEGRQRVIYLPQQYDDVSIYFTLHYPRLPSGARRVTGQLMHCLGPDSAPHPPCNLYDQPDRWGMSYSGWRRLPNASFLLSAIPLPPFEARAPGAQRECIVGELALAAYDGEEGGVPPERWVYHFSVPWTRGAGRSGRELFAVRSVTFNNSDPSDPQYETEPESFGRFLYSKRGDKLENRLLVLQQLGYAWAFPWSWNIPGPGLFYGPARSSRTGTEYWEAEVAPALRRFNRLRARTADEIAAAMREVGARTE